MSPIRALFKTLRETSWLKTFEFLTNRKLRNFHSHRQEIGIVFRH